MSETQPPSRTRFEFWFAIACVLIVFVSSFTSRRTGACGTTHYATLQIVAGTIVSLMESVLVTRYDRLIADGLAIALNVVAFGLVLALWYRNAENKWYIAGCVVGTCVYLLLYFFLYPTTACP